MQNITKRYFAKSCATKRANKTTIQNNVKYRQVAVFFLFSIYYACNSIPKIAKNLSSYDKIALKH